MRYVLLALSALVIPGTAVAQQLPLSETFEPGWLAWTAPKHGWFVQPYRDVNNSWTDECRDRWTVDTSHAFSGSASLRLNELSPSAPVPCANTEMDFWTDRSMAGVTVEIRVYDDLVGRFKVQISNPFSTTGYHLWVSSDGTSYQAGVGGGGGSQALGSTGPRTEGWHHVLIRSEGVVSVFFDGQPMGTAGNPYEQVRDWPILHLTASEGTTWFDQLMIYDNATVPIESSEHSFGSLKTRY